MSKNNVSRYEVLLLCNPEINQEEASQLLSHLEDIVVAAQGEVLSVDRWGKYKLAYAVRKYEYGIYYLLRFEIPSRYASQVVDEMNRTLSIKFNVVVMRHMFQLLSLGASLAYTRPESLEESPRRNFDEFLKDKNTRNASAVGEDEKIEADRAALEKAEQDAIQELVERQNIEEVSAE